MDVAVHSIDISDGQNVVVRGEVTGDDDWRTAVYIKIADDERILARERIYQVPGRFELVCDNAVKEERHTLFLLLERYNLFRVQTKIYRLEIPGRSEERDKEKTGELYKDLEKFLGKTVLMVLKPKHLNILGQSFTPVICGKVSEITKEYVEVQNVNIRMHHAPDFEFPTPLVIPLSQLSVFTPFDGNIKFSLA